MAVPQSPERFGQVWHNGPVIGVGASLPVDNSIDLIVDLSYSRMALNSTELLLEAGIDNSEATVKDGATDIIGAFVGAKVRLIPGRSNIRPYLTFGTGAFRISISDATVSGQQQSETLQGSETTAIGIGLGAGIDFVLTERTTFFIEGRHNICYTETTNTQYLPIRVGLSLR